MNKSKTVAVFFLLGYIIISSLAVLLMKPVYFISILIVILPPSLLNFFWLKNSKKKIFIFSALATLLFFPAVELSARVTNLWDVQSLFYRPFGFIPLENMLFAFLNFLWGLSFYEYFVDKDGKDPVSPNTRYLVLLFIVFSAVVFGGFLFNPESIKMSYLALSVPILLVPSLIIFGKNPQLLKKTVLPTVFFAVVILIYEMASISIGSWWFPGEYFYTFTINGKIFPIDDIIVWYLLSTPALIGGYEFFWDDYK